MTRRWIAICIALAALAGAALVLLGRGRHSPDAVAPRADLYPDVSGPCPGETRSGVMPDVYLRGILEKGAPFRVTLNWYACRALERGDLVYYRFSRSHAPVVKVARAVPGDRFRVVRDPGRKAWNLEIDGELVESGGQPYFFGTDAAPPPLALFEKSRGGRLGEKEAIVLSAFPPGDTDSGTVGVVSTDDLIGKVEPIR
jgi:type IV secretory pathway protease TraF